MSILKFKKSKNFDFDGEYTTEVNGIKYKVWRNGDLGGCQEWYFHKTDKKSVQEFSDKYLGAGSHFSCLFSRKEVEMAIITDANKNSTIPCPLSITLNLNNGWYENQDIGFSGNLQQAGQFAMEHNFTSIQIMSSKN